jgi:hypothetical protein
MELLLVIIAVVLVFGGIILYNHLNFLQWQIDFRKKEVDELRKKNHELTLRMIKVEGKTNSHEIQINGVRFTSNINEINLKYLSKLMDKGE